MADLGFEFRGGKHCAARQVGENFKRPVLGTKKKTSYPYFSPRISGIIFFLIFYIFVSPAKPGQRKKKLQPP